MPHDYQKLIEFQQQRDAKRFTFNSGLERYEHDPAFRALVDMIVAHIEHLQFTPSEIRDAAMFAYVRWESLNPQLPAIRVGL